MHFTIIKKRIFYGWSKSIVLENKVLILILILGAEPKYQVIWTISCKVMHIWAYLQILGHNFATDNPNDLIFWLRSLNQNLWPPYFLKQLIFTNRFSVCVCIAFVPFHRESMGNH